MRTLYLSALLIVLAACEPAPTCSDGKKNGTESDVDCGGACAQKCTTDKACSAGGDCDTSICSAGVCAAPSCTDSQKNAMESDVDCGGPTCAKCPNTKGCGNPGDCQSGLCTGRTCVAPSCMDSLKNAMETDVDCGGPSCGKCMEGRSCGGDGDCATGNCDAAKCEPAISLTKVDPALGPTMGGTVLTLTGAGFKAATTVLLGQTPATDVMFVSATEIKAKAPAFAMADLVDLSVQVGGKKQTMAKGYRYHWTTVGLGTAANTAVAGTAEGLWVGDIDGDMHLDVLTANFGSANVSLLRGKAGGGFETRVDFAAGVNPARVVVGDFNKDMKPDIAVTNFNAGTVGVLINNGNTTFKAPVTYAGGGTQLVGLVAADLDGDGNLDLSTANRGGTARVSVLLGNGDANGTFKAAVNYAEAAGAYALTGGDFNGDGKPDLASTHISAASVAVFLNNGDGTLKARTDYAAAANTYQLVAVDLNGDGKPDLAATENTGTRLGVFLNKGDGTGTFNTVTNTTLPTGLNGIAHGDANKDGKADLVVSTGTGARLLLGLGNGTFGTPIASAAITNGYGIALVDLNGDGKVDVFGTSGSNLVLLPGTAM